MRHVAKNSEYRHRHYVGVPGVGDAGVGLKQATAQVAMNTCGCGAQHCRCLLLLRHVNNSGLITSQTPVNYACCATNSGYFSHVSWGGGIPFPATKLLSPRPLPENFAKY